MQEPSPLGLIFVIPLEKESMRFCSLLPLLAFLSLTQFGSAQNRYNFEDFQGFKVFENGDSLELAWAGGMNYMQFGSLDLNVDGIKDLVAYDRSGNRVMPFENKGTATAPRYRYAPKYIKYFPPTRGWIRLVDYNCDGKEDLFLSVPLGMGVYENTSDTVIKFTWALPSTQTYLTTNYGQPNDVNLYVTEQDIPAVADVDNDGDIDVLTFGIIGTSVEFHENSMPCGLDFEMTNGCWGYFRENFSNNSVVIDACLTGKSEATAHTGSTLLALDLDSNNLTDLILGDVSFTNATAVFNQGTLDSAHITSQDSTYPSYNVPVNLYVFPAFSYTDVDGDGVKDFITSPNAAGSLNHDNVWMYKNNGTTNFPILNRISTSFLQEAMIEMGENAYPYLVDLNGDDLLDLVVGSAGFYQSGSAYDSRLYYYENTGTVSAAEFTLVNTNLAGLSGLGFGSHLVPAFGDLDGDGDQDLVLGDLNGELHLFTNTGSATAPAFTLATPSLGGIDVGSNAAPFLFDLSGDGNLDLVIGEQSGNLNYYTNNGSAYPPNFTLISNNMGGVDVKNTATNFGYSMPVLFEDSGSVTLLVGSYNRGILQYDSLQNVLSLPAILNGTFGTGNLVSADFEESTFGTSKRTGRNQFLIRASELHQAGFVPGKIESISFQISTSNNPVFSQGLDVNMKLTSDTILQGFHQDMSLAYTGITVFTQGWQALNLHYPFYWDGESNLVVEVCFSKNLPNPDIHISMTDVGWNAHSLGDITGWNTNTAKGCEMPYLQTITKRPNVKFTLKPTFLEVTTFPQNGFNLAPTVGDLNGDGFREMIIGNTSGGLFLKKGIPYVAPPVSLPELPVTVQELHAYPNPSSGKFTLEFSENQAWKTLRVIDLQGRVVLLNQHPTSGMTINLEHLSAGIYNVVVSSTSSLAVARLVVLPK